MTRIPRKFFTSWVNHPRPHGRPQYTYGHSLNKLLKRAGILSAFKEWSQLAQDRTNLRKLFYAKAEFPPTRQNWSFLFPSSYIFLTFAPSSKSVFNPRQCRPISTANFVFELYLEGYLIIIIINRPELHFLCKFSGKNDHFWGIWENLTQKWRKKCISGQFQAK